MQNGTRFRMSVVPGRSVDAPDYDPACILKVGGIQAYRVLTNEELKESKKFIEDVMSGNDRVFALNIKPRRFVEDLDVTFESARAKLFESGFIIERVHDKRYKQADSVRRSAITALELGDLNTAEILTKLLVEQYGNVELEDIQE